LPPKIRSTRRQLNRLWLLAIVTSSVLLTFLVIPNGFSTAQSITQQVVHKLMPTPAPALPPGYDSFYIDKDIPWVTVFADAYQIILLHESLNTLPPEQRTGLVSAIQAELGKLFTSETVQPEEQYAGESGPVTARQRLRATLHFQLDTNSNWVCFANMQTHSGLLCGIDRQDCRQLCSAPWKFRLQETAASVAS